MTIVEHIETIRKRLRRGEFISEAAVSQGILLPALHALGWPVFDTSIVIPEYSLEGRRVDYALCHPALRPAVFIEVKKVGFSNGADRQLFEYAFHLGVPMAILTDGQEWNFYLPGEQGRYDERRVYKLDLLERDVDEVVNRLERYLKYERVCSGDALRSARADYMNVARNREIEDALPKAWESLLKEPDSILLELFADKVEDICGYKPDLDVCSKFLTEYSYSKTNVLEKHHTKIAVERMSGQQKRKRNSGENFAFTFEGKTYHMRSARDLMVKVFQLLAKADYNGLKNQDNFLSQFIFTSSLLLYATSSIDFKYRFETAPYFV